MVLVDSYCNKTLPKSRRQTVVPTLFLLLGKWSFCFSTPHFRGSEVVMIIRSFVLFIEYLTMQVVSSYNPNARATVNCVCFGLFKSKRTHAYIPYLVTKKFLCSLGIVRVRLELLCLMMFDVKIIIMITMCDLMDQFPNFMFRN